MADGRRLAEEREAVVTGRSELTGPFGAGLAGKVAIVTGGGRGIGRATAELLAEAGAHVTICARSSDELAAVAATSRTTSSSSNWWSRRSRRTVGWTSSSTTRRCSGGRRF
jgi:siroheme synthase (precorrin-2 oxidase/ferrochelatase)